jgi:hypothetical protein
VFKGPVVLRADEHTLSVLETRLIPSVESSSGNTVVMTSDRSNSRDAGRYAFEVVKSGHQAR